MMVDLSVFAALLLSGLVGSLGHCLGMCGPLVIMVGLQLKSSGRSGLPYHLLYHGARIAVYALMGALVGVIGSLLGLAGRLNDIAGVASLLLGLGVILFGLGYLGWLPLGRMEGGGAWLTEAMGRALKQGGSAGVVALGALNGLLPCGLVYSALLVAASTGGPLSGGLGMVVFGVGTLPPLLLVGMGATAVSVEARQRLTRIAGALIIVVGLQLLLRGMAALGVVPHLHLGRLVLW
jgi:sulfite exporter TauE/SafE